MASGNLLKIWGHATVTSGGGGSDPGDPDITDVVIDLPSSGRTLLGLDYSGVPAENVLTWENTADEIVFQYML